MTIDIRPIPAPEIESRVPALTALLAEAINDGASLGFLPPLDVQDGRNYWISLSQEIRSGARVLLAAFSDEHLIGAAQLALPQWPNARHRAEIQKVMVAGSMRGRGVGTMLMSALHDVARRRGRHLLLLTARHGDRSQTFYASLGYRAVGVVPGYTLGPQGERYDNVNLYHELAD
ncbi:MAG: GNAT family N-acetyltransferase [bacterium]